MFVSESPFFPRPLRSNGSEETRATISLFLIFSLCGESCVVVCTHEISIRTRRRRRIPIISFPPVYAKKRKRSKIIFTTPRIWQNPAWGGEKKSFLSSPIPPPTVFVCFGLNKAAWISPKKKGGGKIICPPKMASLSLSNQRNTSLSPSQQKKRKEKRKQKFWFFWAISGSGN